MNSDQVVGDLTSFLRGHPAFAGLLPASVAEDDSLIQANIMDSVGIFHMIIFLEQKFNIEVEPQDITEDNFVSLKAIAEFVRRKMDAGLSVHLR